MTAIHQRATVRPDGSVEVRNPALVAGAEVEVIVLVPGTNQSSGEPYAFLSALENAQIDGPADWSDRFEDYLHGGRPL